MPSVFTKPPLSRSVAVTTCVLTGQVIVIVHRAVRVILNAPSRSRAFLSRIKNLAGLLDSSAAESTVGFNADGQTANFPARFFLSDSDLIGALQVEPKLRAVTKPVSRSQRGIPGYAPAVMEKLRHTVRRHIELTRQFGGSYTALHQFVR